MKQGNPTRNIALDISESLICPRCLGYIPNNESPGESPGVTSRTDNQTKVCSDCGRDEYHENLNLGGAIEQSLWPSTNRIPLRDAGKTPEARTQEVIDAFADCAPLIAYLDEIGAKGTLEDIHLFHDSFLGTWATFEEYVSDYVDGCDLLADVPDYLVYYFDLERFARDIELEGATFAVDTGDGSVWVFTWP